jgi:RimJ/RimL family protein N-acetyltransferase
MEVQAMNRLEMNAPGTLAGTTVRLEPLSLDHLEGLCSVGLDQDLWAWSPVHIVSSEGMRHYIEAALALREAGTAFPFATVLMESGNPVGSTRFGNIDRENHRVEIGWTWIGREWQRTAVNTEAKYLMLKHAFEVWRCTRVEFKTDVLNQRSRHALKRLGAVEEGVLRKHMQTDQGRIRDTVYFSILSDEWLQVRRRLEAMLR